MEETLRSFVLLLAILALVYWAAHRQPAVARNYPAYCVSPFTSEDLRAQVFEHCSNIPMWSIKV